MKFKKYIKYKDSGVEWLGEIPEYWEVKRVKELIRKSITDGPHETPEFIDKGIPFFSVDSIQNGELIFENSRYISEFDHNKYSKKCCPEYNDILLGKAASVGKVARIKTKLKFNIWSPLALIKLKFLIIDPAYFEYHLKSKLTRYQIAMFSNMNTQLNLGMKDIPRFLFPIPPKQTQTKIANYLDEKTSKIDDIIKSIDKNIKTQKEFRKTLINDVVTGKIKVA